MSSERRINSSRANGAERLIRHTYQSHNKYGLMIKTLFLSGARVNEFVHIRVEDLHLDGDPSQIYLSHCKKESNRYVPVLPALAQELRTHLNGRRSGYLFETNRNDRYSVRTVQSVVKAQARQAGIEKRVYPYLLRHSIATILLDSGEVPIDQVQKFRSLSIQEVTALPVNSRTIPLPDRRKRSFNATSYSCAIFLNGAEPRRSFSL